MHAFAAPAHAQQEPPKDAPVRLDWLTLAPVFEVTNLGWDDNVLAQPDDAHQIRDFTATVSPAVQGWLRFPGLRVYGRADADFVYYKDVSQYRSVDTDNEVRVEGRLGRIVPYFDNTWTNARHRFNYEIDVPIRRVDTWWQAGVDARLTGKTAVGVWTSRTNWDYTGDTQYLGVDLKPYLVGTAKANGARVKYALTPLTTVGVEVSRYETDLPEAPERNADGNRVTTMVEFRPLAPLQGRAEFGFLSRKFRDGEAPPFSGRVMRMNLSYWLLGRTLFAVEGNRDLSYSYRPGERDYLQTGFQLFVTHRIAEFWDARAWIGRFTLQYGLGVPVGSEPIGLGQGERVNTFGLGIGRYVGVARIGFEVRRQARTSEVGAWRDYERTRITSSVTYRF